jgi:iron(III) transport system substrate-binding protein
MFKKAIILLLMFSFSLFLFSQGFAAEELSKLIDGAKKEGKVVFWSSGLTPSLVKSIEAGFKKKYKLAELEMIYAPTRTSEQVAKVSQELKARRLTVDIISGAIPVFYYQLLKAGEAMRYESPEYKHFPQIKGVCQEPGYWVATNAFSPVMMWNPKYVKNGIQKYSDLLDPQFKGKICSGDPKKSDSYLMGYIGLRKILGKDFFVKLAKQDIIWLTRSPDITNKVVTGEYPVALMGNNRTAYVAAMQGAEIEVDYPKEGVVMLANPFLILSKAPHPNAAKLLIDYVSSEEGQKLMTEKSGYFIGREGVPVSPKVLKFTPPMSKINIIPIDWKSISLKEMNEMRDEFMSILGK